jgi:hypothetical protein
MEFRFRRGLLPALFVMIALMLSVHQASASEHAHCIGIETVAHTSAHGPMDAEDGTRAIVCCAFAVGLTIAASDLEFYGMLRSRFTVEAASVVLYPHLRSKHFRPPRLA